MTYWCAAQEVLAVDVVVEEDVTVDSEDEDVDMDVIMEAELEWHSLSVVNKVNLWQEEMAAPVVVLLVTTARILAIIAATALNQTFARGQV